MKRIFNSKISVKLFIITAFIFSSVLFLSLVAQAYYYNHTYIVYSLADPTKFMDLESAVDKSDMSAVSLSKIFNKYKDKYNMESAVFLRDKTTMLFKPEEMADYPCSPILLEVINDYLVDSVPKLDTINFHNLYKNTYVAEDGLTYSIAVKYMPSNEHWLLSFWPIQTLETPGLVDQYYIHVLIMGVVASFVLFLIFSILVTKPLVRINVIAKDMAKLNFTKKIQQTGDDELGQLSSSLNFLSEKLDYALKELSAANARLEKDIEKERELEKMREEFVANVSHELKTPIAIIKGYGEALKDNVRIDKQEHYLNQIIQHSNTMSKLVEDMLELSRIESGHYRMHITDFDIAMLTQNIIENLRFLAAGKKLQITQEYASPEIIIKADRMKISQVIKNFIYNAIQYTPASSGIFVHIYESEEYIRFEVENEGVSIAPDKLHRVWSRFYREEVARNKNNSGTGLGLAISEKILQAHNMAYGVENTSRGVMFYFSYVR